MESLGIEPFDSPYNYSATGQTGSVDFQFKNPAEAKRGAGIFILQQSAGPLDVDQLHSTHRPLPAGLLESRIEKSKLNNERRSMLYIIYFRIYWIYILEFLGINILLREFWRIGFRIFSLLENIEILNVFFWR